MKPMRYVRTRLKERRAQLQANQRLQALSEKAWSEIREGPQARHFQFVVVELVESDNAADQHLAGKVIDAVYEHDGVVTTAGSSLVIGCFGLLMSEDSKDARAKLVRYLLERHGNSVRIAHGACTGISGYMGKSRRSYNVVIPSLHEIREKLSETEFGTAFEVPEKGAPPNPDVTQPRSGDIR